jgi:hypothetical protein
MSNFEPANDKNMITIVTTMSYNFVSDRRRTNLINEMQQTNMNIVFVYGKVKKTAEDIATILTTNTRNCIMFFKNTNYKYAFICDDDFHPHKRFFEELNKTLELLPENWRSLHLCPGYLWGRGFRRCKTAGKLDPEYDVSYFDCHESGRFFTNCGDYATDGKYSTTPNWLGGPVAIVLNKENIDSFLEDFNRECEKDVQSNDVIFKRMCNNNDFICKEPLLGFENEQAGTTLW